MGENKKRNNNDPCRKKRKLFSPYFQNAKPENPQGFEEGARQCLLHRSFSDFSVYKSTQRKYPLGAFAWFT